MKKYLVVLLSVLAIVAFATTSFALHQVKDQFEYTPQIVNSSKAMITLGGEIRIRGEVSDNNSDLRDADESIGGQGQCDVSNPCDDRETQYNQRVRINMKATVSPNTLGFVELESGPFNPAGDTWQWGTFDGASGIYGKSNAKTSDLWIRQAYIAHQGSGLLGMPAGLKAGHMLLALGNGLFYDHSKFGDDALLFWMSPADGMEVALVAIKINEQTSTDDDDADAYVATFEGAFGPVNASADVTYLQDNNFGVGGTDPEANATLWNIGLRANADAGPVNIYGDLELQTGEVEQWKTDGSDVDLGGWALLVGASADINDMISVGGEFGYGSGDDIDTDDEYEGFINSLGSGQHYTYLYDQHVATAAQTAISTNPNASSSYIATTNNTGVANTWYINVGADIKATPDLKVAADFYYLAASEKVRENIAGSPRDYEEQDIGIELDGKVTYQLDSNIVYYVEAGYLWAGDFYENVTDSDEIDNPWSVRHGLLLSF